MSSRQNPKHKRPQLLRLFVGGLPPAATERDLFVLFRQFGSLKDVHISRTPEGRSKLFGYVQYIKSQHAQRVLNYSGELFIQKKLVTAAAAIPREEAYHEQTLRARRSLMLKGIPVGIAKDQLVSLVEEFGSLEQLSKLKRGSPQSMFCYITFQKHEDAGRLLQKGEFEFGDFNKITVEKFIPKRLRQDQIQRSSVQPAPDQETESQDVPDRIKPKDHRSSEIIHPSQPAPAGLSHQADDRCLMPTLVKIRESLIISNRPVAIAHFAAQKYESRHTLDSKCSCDTSNIRGAPLNKQAAGFAEDNVVFNIRLGRRRLTFEGSG